MMTIDETLEFADKLYDLCNDFENEFFDWETYPLEERKKIFDSPVYRDCISPISRGAFALRNYARGFKELQFCK